MRKIYLCLIVALAGSADAAQSGPTGGEWGNPYNPNFEGLVGTAVPANLLGTLVIGVSCQPSATSVAMSWPKAPAKDGIPAYDFLIVFNDGYQKRYYVPLSGNATSYTYVFNQTGNKFNVNATIYKAASRDGKYVFRAGRSASLTYTKANGSFSCKAV